MSDRSVGGKECLQTVKEECKIWLVGLHLDQPWRAFKLTFYCTLPSRKKNLDQDLRGYVIWALRTRFLLYLYSLLLLLTLGEILIKNCGHMQHMCLYCKCKIWSGTRYMICKHVRESLVKEAIQLLLKSLERGNYWKQITSSKWFWWKHKTDEKLRTTNLCSQKTQKRKKKLYNFTHGILGKMMRGD